jgi:NADPH:quinone reductase-like Zn-dependent oxidoreductase
LYISVLLVDGVQANNHNESFKNAMKIIQVAVFFLVSYPLAFGLSPLSWKKSTSGRSNIDFEAENSSRRTFFRESFSSFVLPLVVSGVTTASSLVNNPLVANADDVQSLSQRPTKVLVLGGSGFVGSRVVKKLKAQGVEVLSTSTNGRDGTIAFDATQKDIAIVNEIESLSKGCTAVISCIGSIGTPNDNSINAATGLAAKGAKAAGVDRFVYISVAPEVKEFAKGIDFLKDYMEGKTFSQDAIESNFPNGKHVFIEPTFIYGGDSFSVNPPRVASFYGEFIETLLSSGIVRGITNVSTGFIKIALEPPVSVDSVSAAACNAATGKISTDVLDTYDKIIKASEA